MIQLGIDISILYEGEVKDAKIIKYNNGHYLVYIYKLEKEVIIHCKDILEIL